MRTLLEQFTGRRHSPLVQFVKYAIAGAIATAVQVSLFYLFALKLLPALNERDLLVGLLHLRVIAVSDAIRARNSAIDNMIAFVFSNLTAYLINVAWVFESGRHHRAVEIGFFYLVSGISMFIGTALMSLLIGRFGVMTTVAFAANVVVSMMLNFVLRKYAIFKG
jgi:putative flippase GtrA